MLLVVTNRDDLHADWLIIELQRRGAEFARFNTEVYPHEVSLRWTPTGASLRLPDLESELDLSAVESVWFRRPVVPTAPEGVSKQLAEWAVREAQEALDGVWRTLDARWVNHPDANWAASCKPEQLARAERIGFEIPPTVVTNDAEQLRAFALAHGPAMVCKPLYEGWLPSAAGNRTFWTSRFELAEGDGLDELNGEPYLFQGLIEKSYDVRVTVIGHEAFAVGIGSQSGEASIVDWRRGDLEKLDHWIEDLPGSVSRRCVETVAGYGLEFGAIDLARTPDGRWVFFELNPNGQWVWLEQRTGLPLRARLADLLLEHQ